jgi:hypothetical protein
MLLGAFSRIILPGALWGGQCFWFEELFVLEKINSDPFHKRCEVN